MASVLTGLILLPRLACSRDWMPSLVESAFAGKAGTGDNFDDSQGMGLIGCG